jgi:hypothetical protein
MRNVVYGLTILTLLLTACAGASAPTALTPTAAAPTAIPTLEPPTVLPATEIPATSAPIAVPEVKEEFVATDPSTVQLAAGQPQLVEFFAFW